MTREEEQTYTEQLRNQDTGLEFHAWFGGAVGLAVLVAFVWFLLENL